MRVLLEKENGDYLAWNWAAWTKILRIAYINGWQPAGTQYPYYINYELGIFDEVPPGYHDVNWCGTYFSFINDGQLVKSDDARNICKALEKALQKTELSLKRLKFRRDLIAEFIDFCQGDKFAIF